MGQSDIFELLKVKRLSGDNNYFSAREIQRMLNGKGLSIGIDSISNNLFKLRMFGYLDLRIDSRKVNRVTYPFSVYRLKKEYL